MDRVRSAIRLHDLMGLFVVMTVMFIMSLTAFTDTQFQIPVEVAYGAIREGEQKWLIQKLSLSVEALRDSWRQLKQQKLGFMYNCSPWFLLNVPTPYVRKAALTER